MPVPDEQLMTRWCDGDEAAFAELYARYSQPIMSYICRLMFDRQLAEDCFQETFYRVFAYAASYDASRPFRPWLFRIATNVCRSSIPPSLPVIGTPTEPAARSKAEEAPAVDPTAGHALAIEIRSALLTLSLDQRTVVVLHHYYDLSYPEMAIVLGIPVGTVKSRMNAALTYLRRQFRPTTAGSTEKEVAP